MKIAIAITGASGTIYAKQLIEKLSQKEIRKQIKEAGIVFTSTALSIWKDELGTLPENFDFNVFKNNDFTAPFASGSANYDIMIICPCSMGMLGRIANGISNDLISRAADVILKERKKLIIVPRETPFNLIHIRNMETLTLAGAIICPAMPSFYSRPKSIEEVVNTVVDRILDIAGFKIDTYRWQTLSVI